MIKTHTTLNQRLNQSAEGMTDSKLTDLVDTIFSRIGPMNKTAVALTAAAQTTLFTVPDGYDLYIEDIIVEGKTAQSGGTGSILKVGAAAALNQLNETSGHTFTSATATTLIAANDRRSMRDLYPGAAMNSLTPEKIAGGTAVVADVTASTAVVTAGEVYVELVGFLRPQS